MFRLVVLSALLAIVAARPGFLHHDLAYAAPVVAALPSAVSHQSRVDIISKPVVTAYTAPAVVAAPIVEKTVFAAPAVAVPAAVSHTSRVDVHAKPIIAAYAAPAFVAAPIVHKTVFSEPLTAVHGW